MDELDDNKNKRKNQLLSPLLDTEGDEYGVETQATAEGTSSL